MARLTAKVASYFLNGIARFFVQTASPTQHRPEIPNELR
ncbi:cyclic lactone autoinducer peptide [Paenibacillus hodogayensis]|uniref:Cyclic lactone autoinducer peptide n=1 Tax=Paenibacillus hodogayensis TaxID=279208 RepID=A0ABV5W059_9BACL